MVIGIQTGGRWSDEAAEVVRQLACARARDVPAHLCDLACHTGGEPPALSDLFAEDPWV